jgi:hypothetical protein
MAAKMALGLEVRVLARPSCSGGRWARCCAGLGAIPVDRSSPRGTVEQAVAIIRDFDRIWFTLTPEGTRKPVEKWKTGFWKIARRGGVPAHHRVLPLPREDHRHQPTCSHTSGDMGRDVEQVASGTGRGWARTAERLSGGGGGLAHTSVPAWLLQSRVGEAD